MDVFAIQSGQRKRNGEMYLPIFSTSPSKWMVSPAVPPGRKNSVEIFTLGPVGAGRPDVVHANEAIESVSWNGHMIGVSSECMGTERG